MRKKSDGKKVCLAVVHGGEKPLTSVSTKTMASRAAALSCNAPPVAVMAKKTKRAVGEIGGNLKMSQVATPVGPLEQAKKTKLVVEEIGGSLKMSQVATPVGPLSLGTSSEGLCLAYFDSWWEDSSRNHEEGSEAADVVMRQAKAEIQEYFAGQRTEFTVPLVPEGTSFQKKAWSALAKIPYGETICYAEQAKSMKEPGKARAVGAANGKNPICCFLPCHRVIGKDGGLCGFASGLEIKEYLLNLESRVKSTV